MDKKYLNVKIKNQNALNCLAAIFVNVADYYDLNYQGIYKGIWGFDYNEQESDSILDSMRVPLYVDTREILTYEHGLETTANYKQTANEVFEVIRKDLKEGNPIGICINAYNCEWSISYRKLRFMHNCLIIGDNTEKEVFYVCDPFFNVALAELPYKEFLEGYGYNHRFKKSRTFTEHNLNWREDIKLALINNKESFEKIKKFGSLVLKKYKELGDLDSTQYKAYEFMYFFRLYYFSRHDYIEYLEYIMEKSNAQFHEEIRLLQSSKEYWGLVWRLIQKMINITEDTRIKRYAVEVKEYLDNIAEIESKVWQQLFSKINM